MLVDVSLHPRISPLHLAGALPTRTGVKNPGVWFQPVFWDTPRCNNPKGMILSTLADVRFTPLLIRDNPMACHGSATV